MNLQEMVLARPCVNFAGRELFVPHTAQELVEHWCCCLCLWLHYQGKTEAQLGPGA